MAGRGYLRGVSTRATETPATPAAAAATPATGAPTEQPPRRIVIQYPTPAVDGGRYPAKRCVGDELEVSADVFRDGHELIRAVVRYRGPGDSQWQEAELARIDAHLGGVRWAGRFAVDRPGRWQYTVEAWTDLFGTWRDELTRKVAAATEALGSELSE
jgi:starch synthase (maltosyl-transferring)